MSGEGGERLAELHEFAREILSQEWKPGRGPRELARAVLAFALPQGEPEREDECHVCGCLLIMARPGHCMTCAAKCDEPHDEPTAQEPETWAQLGQPCPDCKRPFAVRHVCAGCGRDFAPAPQGEERLRAEDLSIALEVLNLESATTVMWRARAKTLAQIVYQHHLAQEPRAEGEGQEREGPPQGTPEWIAYWSEVIAADVYDVPSIENREEFKAALEGVLNHVFVQSLPPFVQSLPPRPKPSAVRGEEPPVYEMDPESCGTFKAQVCLEPISPPFGATVPYVCGKPKPCPDHGDK